MGGKKNLNELTNKEKLWFSYKKAITNNPESFSGDQITNYFNNTSLSNLGINLEDINYYNSQQIQYIYDNNTNTYNINPKFNGFGYNTVETAYTKIYDYKKQNELYTVPVKYLWYLQEPAQLYHIYGSYNDALTNTNNITNQEVNIKTLSNSDKEKLIEENNIETYNYVFKKLNNKIYLIDFYVN